MSVAAIGGAVAGAVITGAMSDSGGGGGGGGGQISAAEERLFNLQAEIGEEEWNIWKEEGLPILRELAGMTDVADRSAEEQSLVAQAVKSQDALGRRELTRGLELGGRNPSDPGYGALLAPSYLNEAGDVAAGVTKARRDEEKRVEDMGFARRLDVAGLYKGLPGQAATALAGAGNTMYQAGALNLDAQRLQDIRNSQSAYGGYTLGRAAGTAFGRWLDSPRPGGGYGGGGGGGYSGTPASYTADLNYAQGDTYRGASPFEHGGAIKRRYADGGEVIEGEGGQVEGPGTGTSDSVSAVKRPGSYVLSADTVRAIGTKKITDFMEKAGVRAGFGEESDPSGQPVKLSKGEFVLPPEVTAYHGEEFFNKLQQKYHRPVQSDPGGVANGGAIKTRELPHSVEEAIFRTMPTHAIRRG